MRSAVDDDAELIRARDDQPAGRELREDVSTSAGRGVRFGSSGVSSTPLRRSERRNRFDEMAYT